jgi:hypothetical protein
MRLPYVHAYTIHAIGNDDWGHKMLANFEELILKCVDNNSRSHIREATRCYEAGAYRAAIVAAYISVCFDLIEKLKFLALSGDGEAKAKTTELEKLQKQQARGDQTAIPGLLSFERGLPLLFRDKFEFFGLIEYDHIDRLMTDRNRCAHPTFLHTEEPYHPSAEVARLHIRNALDLVLTQEPKQGKAALESMRLMICSEYFPKIESEVAIRIESSPLKSGRDILVRAFVDDASFGIATKDNPYYTKAAAVKAIEAVVALRPGVAFERYRTNIGKLLVETDKVAVRYGALMAIRSPEIANVLADAARSPLKIFITNPVGVSKASALERSLKIEWLRDFAKSEIAKLNSEEIRKARIPPADEIVERAVEIIVSVKNYEAANKVSDDLLSIMKYLTEDQIERILQAAEDGTADLSDAYGFEAMVQAIAIDNSIGIENIKLMLKSHNLKEPKWIDPNTL